MPEFTEHLRWLLLKWKYFHSWGVNVIYVTWGEVIWHLITIQIGFKCCSKHLNSYSNVVKTFELHWNTYFWLLNNLKRVQRSLLRTASYWHLINSAKSVKFILLNSTLTHLMPLVSFDIPWKRQKIKGFLMFSGGIERDQWHEMR